jgi:hypothetical protein
MSTYTFQEVTRREQRRIKCEGGCGKTLTRTQTFMQTLNPFNKNADGELKSRQEINAELKVEAEAWQPTGMCPKCIERIEGPKPVPPKKIVVRVGGPFWLPVPVVEADSRAEARDKVAAQLREQIAALQKVLDATSDWRFHHYPSDKCKHEGPCFPSSADGGAE